MDKRDKFRDLAVTGAISPLGRSAVQSCVECQAAQAEPQECHGFGPGCLVRLQPPVPAKKD